MLQDLKVSEKICVNFYTFLAEGNLTHKINANFASSNSNWAVTVGHMVAFLIWYDYNSMLKMLPMALCQTLILEKTVMLSPQSSF